MQTVIDNILVNYEVQGQENKNTILILHGWGQNLSHWQSVTKILSEKNKVILLDLPGFGSSTVPQTIFNTDDYANLVQKFVKKLDLSKIILIGHSFGGKIAIKLASKYNFTEKLVLISPSGIGSKPFSTNLKIIFFKLLKLIFFWLPKNIKLNLLKYFSSSDYANVGDLKGIFKKTIDERIENDAIKINIPTLIIWSENDKEVNIKNSKILNNLVPNSVVRIIWKMGHSPNIEAPEKLSNLILEYI